MLCCSPVPLSQESWDSAGPECSWKGWLEPGSPGVWQAAWGELGEGGRKAVLGGASWLPRLSQGQRHQPALPFPGAGSRPSLKFPHWVSPGSRGRRGQSSRNLPWVPSLGPHSPQHGDWKGRPVALFIFSAALQGVVSMVPSLRRAPRKLGPGALGHGGTGAAPDPACNAQCDSNG